MAKAQRALLPPEDEARVRHIVETEKGALRQKAVALLAWHEGLTANEAASRAQMSANQVNYLLRIYRRKGLDLFLIDSEPPAPAAEPEPQPAPAEPEQPGAITLEALCAQYRVDMAHARYVGALALQIFDATVNLHRVPQDLRSILEAAAIVHNVALEIDPPNHHLRGRDILMNTPLKGFSDDERRILACTTSFHRKKVRPDAEPVFGELSEELRQDALTLSAILRIADGLDHSTTQTTRIVDIHVGAEEIVIEVDGPHADENGEQSQKKADLWNKHFNVPVRVEKYAPPVDETTLVAPQAMFRLPTASPHMQSTMSLFRAGQIFAAHTISRMEALLRRVHGGELNLLSPLLRETARLKNALELAKVNSLPDDLAWLGDQLEHAHTLAALAERSAVLADEQGGVSVRADAWDAQARETVQTVDLERCNRLSRDLRLAVEQAAGESSADQVAYQVGALLWDRLGALRTVMEHGESVMAALDAVQRLQDYLVAFRELLGVEVGQALDMLTPLENSLMAIHTTQRVMDALNAPPPKRRGRPAKGARPDTELETLRGQQDSRLEMLADMLPALWGSVNSPVFRRVFALAVAAP